MSFTKSKLLFTACFPPMNGVVGEIRKLCGKLGERCDEGRKNKVSFEKERCVVVENSRFSTVKSTGC